MFVVGIERRDGEDDRADLVIGFQSMPSSAGDPDDRTRLNGLPSAVEFDLSMAFEDIVDFGREFVIVPNGIADRCDVQRARSTVRSREHAGAEPAWAWNRRCLRDMPNKIRECFHVSLASTVRGTAY